MTHDDTILTKWGRITSREWLRRKQNEELDRCMGPEQMHYVLCRIPFSDTNGHEIIDYAFRHLLACDPEAARQQLEQEFIADRQWVADNIKRLAAEREAQKLELQEFIQRKRIERAKAKAKPRKPRTRHTPTHTHHSLI